MSWALAKAALPLFGSWSLNVRGITAAAVVAARRGTLQEEDGEMFTLLTAVIDLWRLALNHNQSALR